MKGLLLFKFCILHWKIWLPLTLNFLGWITGTKIVREQILCYEHQCPICTVKSKEVFDANVPWYQFCTISVLPWTVRMPRQVFKDTLTKNINRMYSHGFPCGMFALSSLRNDFGSVRNQRSYPPNPESLPAVLLAWSSFLEINF